MTYIHENIWVWGQTHTIICWNGVGFVNVSIENINPTISTIHGLSVLPSYRKRGKGTKLLKLAEQESKKMGATQACISVEPDSWIEGWYKRKGYEFNSYDEDNLMILVKNLD